MSETFESDPRWSLVAKFVRSARDVRLVELTIAAAADPVPEEGITADLLRAIRVHDLHPRARDLLANWLPTAGENSLANLAKASSVRPGRRGRPDRFYAEWALVYLEELRRTARPIPGLSASTGQTPDSIRAFLHEARQRGLLTAAQSGRAGGQLTERARSLLAYLAEQVESPAASESGTHG